MIPYKELPPEVKKRVDKVSAAIIRRIKEDSRKKWEFAPEESSKNAEEITGTLSWRASTFPLRIACAGNVESFSHRDWACVLSVDDTRIRDRLSRMGRHLNALVGNVKYFIFVKLIADLISKLDRSFKVCDISPDYTKTGGFSSRYGSGHYYAAKVKTSFTDFFGILIMAHRKKTISFFGASRRSLDSKSMCGPFDIHDPELVDNIAVDMNGKIVEIAERSIKERTKELKAAQSELKSKQHEVNKKARTVDHLKKFLANRKKRE